MMTTVTYWDCREDERLTHTDINDAIEEWLDDQHPTPVDQLPETIDVSGYVRGKINPDRYVGRGGILEYLLERFDEEYGDPDRDFSKPSYVMEAIERMFVEAVISEYTVWACEKVCTEIIDVQRWIKEYRPDWLEPEPTGVE